MNDIRFKTEKRKYTKMQRFTLWWWGIVDAWSGVIGAIRKVPDTHYSGYIRIFEGEEGYGNASWSFTTIEHPLRYTYKNGEWMEVEPQPCPPNPNYHDPE